MNAKTIEVVAFDCDGVMFDSSLANQAYYDHLLKKVGLPAMTQEQFNYAHMHTVDETLEYLIPNPQTLAAVRRYRLQMSYLSFIRHMVIEPHLMDLLAKLRPAFKTAIATNRTDTMDRVLSEHHLEGQFDLVVTAMDVQHPKPHPEQLMAVLEFFGVGPEQMVYIGDSPLDAQAAHSAKVHFIAYGNPGLEAAAHVNSLKQVEEILQLA